MQAQLLPLLALAPFSSPVTSLGSFLLLASDNRLLDGPGRLSFINNDGGAGVLFDSDSIHVVHGLPSASPLHEHLVLCPYHAAHQHTHHLTFRGHLSIHPAALPLYEHFIVIAARATAHYDAVPAFHQAAMPRLLIRKFFFAARKRTPVHTCAHLASSTPLHAIATATQTAAYTSYAKTIMTDRQRHSPTVTHQVPV